MRELKLERKQEVAFEMMQVVEFEIGFNDFAESTPSQNDIVELLTQENEKCECGWSKHEINSFAYFLTC